MARYTSQKGAVASEYALLLALVGVATIASVSATGAKLDQSFGNLAFALSSNSGDSELLGVIDPERMVDSNSPETESSNAPGTREIVRSCGEGPVIQLLRGGTSDDCASGG